MAQLNPTRNTGTTAAMDSPPTTPLRALPAAPSIDTPAGT